jgi:hypothetical protein
MSKSLIAKSKGGVAMVRILIVTGLLFAGTGAALAKDPLVGLWAEKKAWCGLRHDNTDIWDRIPLLITADHMTWVTYDCTIVNRNAEGASTKVKAVCEGDGARANEVFTLTLSANQKKLRLAQTGQKTVAYLRCE